MGRSDSLHRRIRQLRLCGWSDERERAAREECIGGGGASWESVGGADSRRRGGESEQTVDGMNEKT